MTRYVPTDITRCPGTGCLSQSLCARARKAPEGELVDFRNLLDGLNSCEHYIPLYHEESRCAVCHTWPLRDGETRVVDVVLDGAMYHHPRCCFAMKGEEDAKD